MLISYSVVILLYSVQNGLDTESNNFSSFSDNFLGAVFTEMQECFMYHLEVNSK